MKILVIVITLFAGCVGSVMAGEPADVRFRLTDLDLRDPHFFLEFLGCRDFTDTALNGFSANGELQNSMQSDVDLDGYLDLSYLLQFSTLDQTAQTSPLAWGVADCTAPAAGTSCGFLLNSQSSTATLNAAMTCLAPIEGTVRPYSPAITNSGPPCFVSSAFTLTLTLFGAPLLLADAQVAATLVGDPVASLSNGLVRGFLSEQVAANTLIPQTVPLIGGQALASLLPGYDGPLGANCAAHNDQEVHNEVVGWWLYFNFPAQLIANLPENIFEDGFEEIMN